MCAASSSLPVPDSPISSTRASERAAMVACSTARCQAGLEPIIFGAAAHQLAQPLVLRAQAGLLQRVLHGQQHAVAAQRLLQKIEGAGARGFHRVGDGAVAGNHDGRRRRRRSAAPAAAGRCRCRPAASCRTGRRRRAARPGCAPELRHRPAHVHRVALALQNHAQRAADILFVIHDQDAFGCHWSQRAAARGNLRRPVLLSPEQCPRPTAARSCARWKVPAPCRAS